MTERYSISRRSLDNRQGKIDQARHDHKVKEAIRDNLPNIVSDESIITANPNTKKIIRIPMRSLELPKFRYGNNEGQGFGAGSDHEPGDIIDGQPGQGDPKGGAGDQPGIEYYDSEITIEELQEIVFADLGLPNLQPKKNSEIEEYNIVYDQPRHKKRLEHIDINRTIYENIVRNTQTMGEPVLREIDREDIWNREYREVPRRITQAVVIAMADISGSIGSFERYITLAFCWWMVSALRYLYEKVEIAFIVHDYDAEEVTEYDFFHRGASGGTRCSSANKLLQEIIEARYNPVNYNVYPFHFSDGDNLDSEDNETCLNIIQKLLELDINQYSYIQIGRGDSSLFDLYRNQIKNENFHAIRIKDKEGVHPALKTVLKSKGAI